MLSMRLSSQRYATAACRPKEHCCGQGQRVSGLPLLRASGSLEDGALAGGAAGDQERAKWGVRVGRSA